MLSWTSRPGGGFLCCSLTPRQISLDIVSRATMKCALDTVYNDETCPIPEPTEPSELNTVLTVIDLLHCRLR